MRKVKLGLIGCGWAARSLYEPAFRFLKKGELVAVMDIVHSRAKYLKEFYGAKRYYTRLKEIVNDDEIDAVVVLTPPHKHLEPVIAAAEAGKHVYCEKPMAPTIREADMMIDVCKRNRVKLMIAFMKRFNKSFRKVKSLIDEGELGQVFELRAIWDNARVTKPPQDAYRLKLYSGGGFLQEDGSHPLDICRWWLGDVEEVSAYVSIIAPDRHETEDLACVVMRHRSGAISTLHITMLTHMIGQETYTVFGTEGTLEMKWIYHSSRSLEPAIIRLYRNSREIIDLTLSPKASWNPLDELRENWQYLVELEHFCECIIEDKTPYCTGEDGRAVVELVNAAYLSAWKGVKVKLPLKEIPDFKEFFKELRAKSPWSLGDKEWYSWY